MGVSGNENLARWHKGHEGGQAEHILQRSEVDASALLFDLDFGMCTLDVPLLTMRTRILSVTPYLEQIRF